MRTLLLAVAAFGAVAWAAPNPAFDKAQTLFAARNYKGTLKELDAAQKVIGVERDVLLIILEQRGICHASLGNQAQAEEAFKRLLALDPKRDISKKYQGLAANAAQAAQAWLGANAPLEVMADPPGSEGGTLKRLSVTVKSDPFALAKQVKFFIKAPSENVASIVAALVDGKATTPAVGPSLTWWAEVLGEKNAQLVLIGSATKPLSATAEAPPAVVIAPPAEKPLAQAKPVEVPANKPVAEPSVPATSVMGNTTMEVQHPKGANPVRIAGYVLMGTAVAALAVGIGIGANSSSMRTSLQADILSGANVLSWPQRDQAQMVAGTTANVLFVVAGVLGISGTLLWFLGKDIAVAPAENGVALSGRF
jgi:hypothetical protein